MYKVYTGTLGCPQILIVLLQEIKLQGTAFMSLTRGLLMRSQTIPLEDPGEAQGTEDQCQRVRNGFENKSRAGKGASWGLSPTQGAWVFPGDTPPTISQCRQWSVIPPRECEI